MHIESETTLRYVPDHPTFSSGHDQTLSNSYEETNLIHCASTIATYCGVLQLSVVCRSPNFPLNNRHIAYLLKFNQSHRCLTIREVPRCYLPI